MIFKIPASYLFYRIEEEISALQHLGFQVSCELLNGKELGEEINRTIYIEVEVKSVEHLKELSDRFGNITIHNGVAEKQNLIT